MRTVRHIKHTFTQRNGGYFVYWRLLFKQGPEMFKSLIPQIKKQVTTLLATAPSWKRGFIKICGIYLFLMMVGLILIKMPWWLFIKPLGSALFHRVKKYEVYANGTRIIRYSCKKYFFLFRFIPIYLGEFKKPTKKDLENLFKNEADSMIFAPEPEARFI